VTGTAVRTSWRDVTRALLGDVGGVTPPSWIPLSPVTLPSGLRIALLIAYYALVLGGLIALYAVNPPHPPPFIYQGF
jgi:hypothetical protein